MRDLFWLLPVAAACLSCSAMHAAAPPTPSDPRPGVHVFPPSQRSPAPQLHGTTITGGGLDLADELGHGPVAINVWASWCGPCRQEMPVLVAAAARNLRVVGIDERDKSGSARAFAASRGATYPSLYDPDGKLLARLPMLPQTGLPSTLFLDRHGRVAARVVGPVESNVLRRILRRLGGYR
jgi:thiol-disulfide isomerase/thioredoxin